jgi:hypothetical protein
MKGTTLRPLLMATLVVGGSSPVLRADDRPYVAFSPEIAVVESGGLWKLGNRWGRYRAVVRRGCSPEHCYDHLFLEWIEVRETDDSKAPREGPASKIIATTRVSEVPGLTHVSQVKFAFSKKETRLQVKHEGTDGEDKWTFCLVLGPPGKYTSKDGSCRGAG